MFFWERIKWKALLQKGTGTGPDVQEHGIFDASGRLRFVPVKTADRAMGPSAADRAKGPSAAVQQVHQIGKRESAAYGKVILAAHALCFRRIASQPRALIN